MTQRTKWYGLRGALAAGFWLVAIGVSASVTNARAANRNPQGLWQGKIAEALRIVVHVNADSAGGLAASVDSPDQGAMGLPVSKATFAGDSLQLELEKLGATYSGRMSEDGLSIAGEWRQSGRVLALLLKRTDAIEQPRRRI